MRILRAWLWVSLFFSGNAYAGLFADESCNISHLKAIYGSAHDHEAEVIVCLDDFLTKLYAKHGFTCTKDNRNLNSFLDETAGYYAVQNGGDLMFLARRYCIVKYGVAEIKPSSNMPFKNRECNFLHDISALQIGRIHGLTKAETETTVACAKGILKKLYAREKYTCEGGEHMNSFFDSVAPKLQTKDKSGLFEVLMSYCIIDVKKNTTGSLWWDILYNELYDRLNALGLPEHKLKHALLRCTAASTVELLEKKCKPNDLTCVQKHGSTATIGKLLKECGKDFK